MDFKLKEFSPWHYWVKCSFFLENRILELDMLVPPIFRPLFGSSATRRWLEMFWPCFQAVVSLMIQATKTPVCSSWICLCWVAIVRSFQLKDLPPSETYENWPNRRLAKGSYGWSHPKAAPWWIQWNPWRMQGFNKMITSLHLHCRLTGTYKWTFDEHGAFAGTAKGTRYSHWGHEEFGGDSSAVQHHLRNVQQIQASAGAFAAILLDGSVVTWGHPEFGGNSSAVQHQLRSVQQIQATAHAFAAILLDGSVITWGHEEFGGDCSKVLRKLKSVKQIQGTMHAFAANLLDGSVVTWGHPEFGGNSSSVQHQLRSVKQIQATAGAFAAILLDGSVITWGHPEFGGDSSAVQHQLRSVQQILATGRAFAAILLDGSVVLWGHPKFGGDSSVQHQLRSVQQIQQDQLVFLWEKEGIGYYLPIEVVFSAKQNKVRLIQEPPIPGNQKPQKWCVCVCVSMTLWFETWPIWFCSLVSNICCRASSKSNAVHWTTTNNKQQTTKNNKWCHLCYPSCFNDVKNSQHRSEPTADVFGGRSRCFWETTRSNAGRREGVILPGGLAEGSMVIKSQPRSTARGGGGSLQP